MGKGVLGGVINTVNMYSRRGCAEWGGWVKMEGGGVGVRGEDGKGGGVKLGRGA